MLTLKNATLVDGTGAAPVVKAVVTIADDGSIVYAGPASQAPATDGEIVDLDGATIFPGFIDCHVHLEFVTGTDDPTYPTVNLPRILMYMKMARNCEVTLEAGVTSARNVLGMDNGFVQAIEQGYIRGPRLISSCGGICAPGGHFDFTKPNGQNPLPDVIAPDCEVHYVSGVAQAREAARKVIQRGAKVIKIAASGGVASPTDSYLDVGLTLDEVQAIVDVANTHQGGITVCAHAEGHEGTEIALTGGVASIEHGSDLTDEQRDFMAKNGIFLVPTLSVNQIPEPGTVSDVVMQKARFQTKAAFENFPKSVAAGVKIAMGTDAGLSPKHGTNLTELTKFLDHGMTPMQAVVAGTRTGAELLRILDETGTVETGKRADLVVAKGDASVDLETVVRGLADTESNVLRVYKDGDLVISRTGL